MDLFGFFLYNNTSMNTSIWSKTDGFADRLREFLGGKLGGEIRLSRISSYEDRTVFRMEGCGSPAFVKVTSNAAAARRAYAYLGRTRLGFVPKARFLLQWEGRSVMGMDWKDGRVVFPEDMNERQCASLLRAHKAVLDELRGSDCADPIDAVALYAEVADFASRCRFAGRFLRGLADLPEEERTLSPETATVTIGDFHCRNYAFDGDEISAFYDFDRIQLGSPAQDLTYDFIRRFRKSGLSRGAKMENLKDRFLQMVNAGVYSPDEWRRSVNIFRLENAAKRLKSHPNLGLVVFDVVRRDRRLERLVRSLP